MWVLLVGGGAELLVGRVRSVLLVGRRGSGVAGREWGGGRCCWWGVGG